VQIFHRKTRIDARSNGRLKRHFLDAETGDEPTFPGRSNNRIALRAERAALFGLVVHATRQPAFDVQAAGFAHGQVVNGTGKFPGITPVKRFNESQDYESWRSLERGKTKRIYRLKNIGNLWTLARFKTCKHLQRFIPVESMCNSIGKAV
jgi:hypothetical protein